MESLRSAELNLSLLSNAENFYELKPLKITDNDFKIDAPNEEPKIFCQLETLQPTFENVSVSTINSDNIEQACLDVSCENEKFHSDYISISLDSSEPTGNEKCIAGEDGQIRQYIAHKYSLRNKSASNTENVCTITDGTNHYIDVSERIPKNDNVEIRITISDKINQFINNVDVFGINNLIKKTAVIDASEYEKINEQTVGRIYPNTDDKGKLLNSCHWADKSTNNDINDDLLRICSTSPNNMLQSHLRSPDDICDNGQIEHALNETNTEPYFDSNSDQSIINTDQTKKRKGKLVCSFCSKSFKLTYKFKRHIRIHTGIKPYICNICGSTFGQSFSLQRHLQIHADTSANTCVICNRCCVSLADLRRHYRTHTDEGFYECEYCSKSYLQMRSLRRHVKLHTATKSYICKICKATFPGKVFLQFHLGIHKKPERSNKLEKITNNVGSLSNNNSTVILDSELDKHQNISKNNTDIKDVQSVHLLDMESLNNLTDNTIDTNTVTDVSNKRDVLRNDIPVTDNRFTSFKKYNKSQSDKRNIEHMLLHNVLDSNTLCPVQSNINRTLKSANELVMLERTNSNNTEDHITLYSAEGNGGIARIGNVRPNEALLFGNRFYTYSDKKASSSISNKSVDINDNNLLEVSLSDESFEMKNTYSTTRPIKYDRHSSNSDQSPGVVRVCDIDFKKGTSNSNEIKNIKFASDIDVVNCSITEEPLQICPEDITVNIKSVDETIITEEGDEYNYLNELLNTDWDIEYFDDGILNNFLLEHEIYPTSTSQNLSLPSTEFSNLSNFDNVVSNKSQNIFNSLHNKNLTSDMNTVISDQFQHVSDTNKYCDNAEVDTMINNTIINQYITSEYEQMDADYLEVKMDNKN